MILSTLCEKFPGLYTSIFIYYFNHNLLPIKVRFSIELAQYKCQKIDELSVGWSKKAQA